MIFVTVGTHEQSFNRLLKWIDEMIKCGQIKEKVIVQKGYSDYIIKNCEMFDFLEFEEINRYISEARIIITHGGPSSFLAPLAIGKIPIVVPRIKEFNEHVNNHQLDFVKKVEESMKNIMVVETKEDLIDFVLNYDKKIKCFNSDNKSNNKKFNSKLIEEILDMI